MRRALLTLYCQENKLSSGSNATIRRCSSIRDSSTVGDATNKVVIHVGASASTTKQFTPEEIYAYRHLMMNNWTNNGHNVSKKSNLQSEMPLSAIDVDASLLIGLVSKVLGTQLPGPQSVYLRQVTSFTEDKPTKAAEHAGSSVACTGVMAGDVVTASVTVKAFIAKRGIVLLDTLITKEEALIDKPTVIATGEVIGVNKNLLFHGHSSWPQTSL